jgi:hypothetical protein
MIGGAMGVSTFRRPSAIFTNPTPPRLALIFFRIEEKRKSESLKEEEQFMKGKRKIRRLGEWALVIGLILFLASACATKRYGGPTMGRSADSQFTLADALEKALKSASFDPYRGKNVWIDVFSLTERTGEESAEERFLRSWLAEKLLSQGARIAPMKNQSDIILDVKARVFGVNQTRRDFILLFYMEITHAIVDLHLNFYERESGKILHAEDLKGEVRYREYYIFYMIGPFRSIK